MLRPPQTHKKESARLSATLKGKTASVREEKTSAVVSSVYICNNSIYNDYDYEIFFFSCHRKRSP